MKKSVFFLSLCALPAFASALNFEGNFSQPHDVAMMGYATKKACKKDGGRWQDGLCLMKGEDSVKVTRDGSEFHVAVDTITTNAHMCSFEGKAKPISGNQLLSSVATEKYMPGENGGEGKFQPATCEVTVTYSADGNSVNVSTNDYASCQEFCGMNAMLDIEGARRQR